MELIDAHCHIYAAEFEPDRKEAIERALAAGVKQIVMPNIDWPSIELMLAVSRYQPNVCWPSLGLHPCSVLADYKDVLTKMEAILTGKPQEWKAIGETGLDYYWDQTFIEEQKAAFDRQLGWSKDTGLPIIIHSRSSLDDCINMLANSQDGKLSGVFHCFSGDRQQLDRIIELGFSVGIGGVLTFKNGGLDKVLVESDLAHIVLETDAPYLAPVPHRGKRNEPSYVALVAERLADLWNMDVEKVVNTTTQNSKRLFQLP